MNVQNISAGTSATPTPTGAVTPDPAAVDAFNASMSASPGTTAPQATDAQVAQMFNASIMQQVLQESFRRMQELASDFRS